MGVDEPAEVAAPPRDDRLRRLGGRGDGLAAAVALANARARLFGRSSTPPAIGRYAVTRRIAVGGQGELFLARDELLRRDVVIKLRHTSNRTMDELVEARALAKLSSPHVLTIYDVGVVHEQSGERVFLAVEYLQGRTLGEWTTTNPPWPARVRVALAITAGLAAAHAAGIVHGDVKPDNIVVAGDGTAKLVDFGLSRANEGAPTGTGSSPGGCTPAYSAPELAAGESSAAGDQFALSLTLTSLLAGAPRRDVDRRLASVLARGTCVDPGERWSDVAELRRRLELAITKRTRSSRWVLLAAFGLATFAWLPAPKGQCLDAPDFDREALHSNFAAVDPVLVDELYPRTVAAADGWLSRWHDTHAAACAAERTGAITCLDHARARFVALLEVLQHGTSTAVREGVQAIGRLPSPQACIDRTQARLVMPESALAQAAIAAAEASFETKDTEAAELQLRTAEALVAGADEHAAAEIAYLRTRIAEHAGRSSDAVELAQQAHALAVAAGDDALAARAALRVVRLLARSERDLDGATLWAGHAEAAVSRSASPSLARLLAWELAELEIERGDVTEGIAMHERLLARTEAETDDADELERQRLALGRTLNKAGRYAEALPLLEQVHASQIERLGPIHPALVSVLSSLGASLDELRQFERAREAFLDTLEIYELVGSNSVRVGDALQNLGVNASLRNQPLEAREWFERAREHYASGDHPVELAQCALNLATAEYELGDLDRALELNRQAVQVLSERYPPGHPWIALAERGVARTAWAMGDASEAITILERLVARADGRENPAEWAYTLVDLADALWSRDAPFDRARAHAITIEAEADFARAGMHDEPRARDWLAEHPLRARRLSPARRLQ